MKTCSKCGVEKPLTEFGIRKATLSGLHSACKECNRNYALEKAEFNRVNNPTPEQARNAINKALAEKGQKRCLKCEQDKPFADFSKVSRNKDGLRPTCRECHNPYAKAINKLWTMRHPGIRNGRSYKNHLTRTYGITLADKERLIADQNGCCAICRNPFLAGFNTHVDHIHGAKPPIVRGILCNHCNFGLGQFKDSPERLANAIEYLKKFQK